MASSQYFDPSPASASRRRSSRVALPDTSFDLITESGVFSADGLDTGTRLLLLEAPAPAADGDLLDLGCGAGPIAVVLGRRSPDAQVWAIDVNERARALCRDNATATGAANVRVCAPDEVPDGVRFSTIWSNPPIRIGKAALHDLLQRWLNRLTDDGVAVLVVQKHLGADSLATWLQTEGWQVDRLRSRAGFRLLVVRRT